MTTTMQHRNSVAAFDDAITAGTLSDDESAANYAGHFMYMCTVNGEDQFKHTTTRRYLHSLTPGFTAAERTTT